MTRCVWATLMLVAVTGIPVVCLAQSGGGVAGEIRSLQGVLDKLYTEMLPLCSNLIGVGRAIAGFAATFYIANRVWRHIANAEPVDFYPLLRPFAVGLAIILFPSVLAVMNGVLQPTVSGTGKLADNSNKTIEELFKKKEEEMKKSDQWKALVGESETGNRELWLKYAHPEVTEEGWIDAIGHSVEFVMDKMAYNFKNDVRYIISVVLELVYAAAALCINTLRTFNLIILAILGPLVLGISVFDGFHHTLNVYLARYINVYLWLPIANILSSVLGKIQQNMLEMDMEQIIRGGQSFFNSYDLGYMIFMLIGIIAYTTVPSIADQIVMAGGGGALQHKVTQMSMGTATTVASAGTGGAMGAAGLSSMARDSFGNDSRMMNSGMSGMGSDYFKDKLSG
ncbi:conjugative transposon protein TraJ [Chitinophaga sp. YIM B06452]|uniref:conjugative transposon protein TraJ n=1 Tax=Chitinophaga sp. YIM B06452 TaxID=3082158 RepID=UPI0031FEAA4F